MEIQLKHIVAAIKALDNADRILSSAATPAEMGRASAQCLIARSYLEVAIASETVSILEH